MTMIQLLQLQLGAIQSEVPVEIWLDACEEIWQINDGSRATSPEAYREDAANWMEIAIGQKFYADITQRALEYHLHAK